MAIKWTDVALEDLRAIGARWVQAQIYKIAMMEINRPREVYNDIEGEVDTNEGTYYWRRCVSYDDIDNFRAYAPGNDGDDEFRCRTASYILIYRDARPDEYKTFALPSGSVLVTNIVANDDLLKDIRQILSLEGERRPAQGHPSDLEP